MEFSRISERLIIEIADFLLGISRDITNTLTDKLAGLLWIIDNILAEPVEALTNRTPSRFNCGCLLLVEELIGDLLGRLSTRSTQACIFKDLLRGIAAPLTCT